MNDFPGRLLGIDHGLKYIGLATCDSSGLIASPLQVIKRKSKKEDFARLNHIIAEQQVVAVILGLPPRPPDFVGHSQSDTVHLWSQRLAAAIAIPVYLWDEGLSSVDAIERLQAANQPIPDRVDAHAAAVILQSFLDTIRAGASWPQPVFIE